MEPTQPEPQIKRFKKKILIGVGIAAAILAIISIVLVSRKSKISETTENVHTHVYATPTLIPTIPPTIKDKIKSLEDEAVVIDRSL